VSERGDTNFTRAIPSAAETRCLLCGKIYVQVLSKTLLGQLKGGYSGNMSSPYWLKQLPSQAHAWNVEALILAALAMPEQDRMSKHIQLPLDAEQLVPQQGAWPLSVGTFFDLEPVKVSVEGRMGDVIEVDLKHLIAHAMLGLPRPDDELSDADKEKILAKKHEIEQLITNLSVDFVAKEKDRLVDEATQETRGMTLVTKADKSIVSCTESGADASFELTGRFFVVPNISRKDLTTLRAGGNLGTKDIQLELSYTLGKEVGSFKEGTAKAFLTITANDYIKADKAIFFGDRPLDDPGYSDFGGSMKGKAIAAESLANDVLSSYRIEQRLKYLGYGISSVEGSDEIKVDGLIDKSEGIVLRKFSQIVQGKSEYKDSEEVIVKKKSTTVRYPPITLLASDIGWLNAYNAPHWMQYEFGMGSVLGAGWESKTDTSRSTHTMGTSWVYDLMVSVKDNNKTADNKGREKLWFSGADLLGTRLNLGVNANYVSQANKDQVNGKDVVLGVIPKKPATNIPNPMAYEKQWDFDNAKVLAALLLNPNLNNLGATSGTFGANANNGTDEKPQLNKQDEALLDFVNVYASTQKSGFWDSINIGNGDAETIRKALFGDGSQSGSVIDSKQLLIGGTASLIGSSMTKESLSTFMGNVSGVVYADWIEPLQQAMLEFDITTPQRIAAFLAQVRAETTGLKKMKEDIGPYRVGVVSFYTKLIRYFSP